MTEEQILEWLDKNNRGFTQKDFVLFKKFYKEATKDLEKENAELKETVLQFQKDSYCGVCHFKTKTQLKQAKELLAKWVELFKPKCGNIPPTPIQVDTEQFLKDYDIDNAIQQANKGLDFDKIADEMEQDLKDSEVEK